MICPECLSPGPCKSGCVNEPERRCPECRGTGLFLGEWCPECSGTGTLTERDVAEEAASVKEDEWREDDDE